MRIKQLGLVPLMVLSLSGCGVTDPIACTLDFRYGLNIRVLDSSGAPAAEGAVGIARDGSYEETMMQFAPDALVGAGERAGTYDITITKEGYSTWSMSNVEVDEDICHVIPVSIDATLTPAP